MKRLRSLLLLPLALIALAATAARAEESKPLTIVIVHGATAGGWEWKETARHLRAAGHDVHRVTLTGLGERHHLADESVNLETHIMDVVNTIRFEDLHDVVLTGHSYGGMVITGVQDRIPDRIKHVFYFDAAVPNDGESMFDLVGGLPPGGKVENGLAYFPWYDADAAPPKGVPHPVHTFDQPVSYDDPAALALNVTYVPFVKDGDAYKERSANDKGWQRAKARGWTIRPFPGSHTAMLENPAGVADLILYSVNDTNSATD